MHTYCPLELKSRQRISWKIRLWDERDEAGEWSEEAFFENNRVASFTIFDDDLCVELTDDMQPQYIVFENPLLIDNLTFTIQSIFSGAKWNDTCITKIIFYE